MIIEKKKKKKIGVKRFYGLYDSNTLLDEIINQY